MLEQELEQRVEAEGFELVELERAGSKARPILRLRIDRPDAEPGHGITVADCARVSRALEGWLDEAAEIAPRYVLEVSSPGVERPLVRRRDFIRFAGEEVAVKGHVELAGRNTRRLEGELLGLTDESAPEGEERIRLRLRSGEEVEIPRADVARANVIFRWDED